MSGYPPPPAYSSASQRTISEDPQQQEVELYESYKEREAYDNLADLYAVILATEHLERAYARDAVTREEVSVMRAETLRGSCVVLDGVGRSCLSRTDRRRRSRFDMVPLTCQHLFSLNLYPL